MTFITAQDVVDRLGRGGTADAGLVSAVASACQMVQTLSGQDLDLATETVTLDGTGTDALVLPQLPVNNVGTVSIRGTVVDPQFYDLKDNGVLVRVYGTATTSNQPLFSDDWQYVNSYSEVRWPLGRQNISVTYSHGYGTVPADLQEVALSLASRLVIQGVALQESTGPNSIRYAVSSTDLTSGEKAIIRKYRQIG